jgi:hypothetical protein
MRVFRTVLFTKVAMVALSGCTPLAPIGAPGILEGHVTIGPICPVEREDQPCPVPPEVYQARKILIFQGGNLVTQVDLDPQGFYRVSLSPGVYRVDIHHIGIDHSADVPVLLAIESHRTIRLDISIDTGIR